MKDKKEHLTEILKATLSIPQVRDALWTSIIPFVCEALTNAYDTLGILDDVIESFEECETPEELTKLLNVVISGFSNVDDIPENVISMYNDVAVYVMKELE